MLVKLSTTINDIYTIPNRENQNFVKEFYEFMKNYNLEKYQNNNLAVIKSYWKVFGCFFIFFYSITKIEQIIKFLIQNKG